jgi:hypothetical protein
MEGIPSGPLRAARLDDIPEGATPPLWRKLAGKSISVRAEKSKKFPEKFSIILLLSDSQEIFLERID